LQQIVLHADMEQTELSLLLVPVQPDFTNQGQIVLPVILDVLLV